NATPDSFSDGGRWAGPTSQGVDTARVCEACAAWVVGGVAVLDVGGESTRPGAAMVSTTEELARVLPVLSALREDKRCSAAALSIDTRHAEVAAAAIEAGAHVVNDVSGLADDQMADVVAGARAGLVIGHMRGTPQTMMDAPHFPRLLEDVARDLERSMDRASRAGVADERIVLDPCIGFGKDTSQSAALTASSGWFEERLGRPVLIGASRKRFLGEMTGRPVDERVLSSVAAALVAVERGAAIVRVHDVLATLEALGVREGILGARREVLREHGDSA
ncbi:MAG: dihydropteroate synthase, partial [Nannocystaceae bacterium]